MKINGVDPKKLKKLLSEVAKTPKECYKKEQKALKKVLAPERNIFDHAREIQQAQKLLESGETEIHLETIDITLKQKDKKNE